MSETSAPPPRLATGPVSLPHNPMQSASANRDTVREGLGGAVQVLLAPIEPANLEDDDESRP